MQVEEMSGRTAGYRELEIEETWIDYLRARLPYSFSHVEICGSGPAKYFLMSGPALPTGQPTATQHNYWRRGNVYYMTGRLLDHYSMSDIWRAYRTLGASQVQTYEALSLPYLMLINPHLFYHSMQLEKVWKFVQDGHLDRERVIVASVTQALELCLKAVAAHASFREGKGFKVAAGHGVNRLYDALPDPLQDEIASESKAFAGDYAAFRMQVETDIKKIWDRHLQGLVSPEATQQEKADWDRIAKRISDSSYTAFTSSSDPGANEKYLHEGWFEEALDRIKVVEEGGGIGEHDRYAPEEDNDACPAGLMLGRFMYEYLFPVPLDTKMYRLSAFPS